MSLLDTLMGIFSDQETNEAFQENPEGFLTQNGFGDVTSQDIQAEMPRVLESLQGNSGGATQGGAASFGNSGNVTLPPPPASGGSGGAGGGEGGGAEGACPAHRVDQPLHQRPQRQQPVSRTTTPR